MGPYGWQTFESFCTLLLGLSLVAGFVYLWSQGHFWGAALLVVLVSFRHVRLPESKKEEKRP